MFYKIIMISTFVIYAFCVVRKVFQRIKMMINVVLKLYLSNLNFMHQTTLFTLSLTTLNIYIRFNGAMLNGVIFDSVKFDVVTLNGVKFVSVTFDGVKFDIVTFNGV